MTKLITDNIDVWTTAQTPKVSVGRGRGNNSNDFTLHGIQRLRELILELAVRGKLITQNPKDEPASVLLEKIAKEKAQLIKEGKIKKQKRLPAITEVESSLMLPVGWTFCRLGALVNSIISGGTPSKRNPKYWNGEIPWASVKDLGKSKYIEDTQDHITQEGLNIGSKLAEIGDLIICTRMGLGKIAIAKTRIAINQDLKAVRLTSQLDLNFFIYFFKTLKIKGTGTTVAGIKQDQLLNYVFFLPPLAEQHRIVAKVDELMALCDQLEQQQADNNETHQVLVGTLLAAITQAQDQADFNESWQRIADHFDTLFTTESSIDQLKNIILQLAIMGKLVPQDPKDEPASILMKKIAKEKARLVREGKIKKQKPVQEISDDEKKFELPNGWEWVRFSELAQEVSTGPFGTMIHKRDYVDGGIPLINPSHMIDCAIVEDSSVAVSQKKAEVLSSYKLSKGDIVLARRGEMGRCAIVTEREDNWLCGTGSFRIRFHNDIVRPYILLLFKTDLVRHYLGGKSVGMTMTNLNHGILNKLPILLPPSAEQHRIVAKVNELMTICDLLQGILKDLKTTEVQLADAIVEQATT